MSLVTTPIYTFVESASILKVPAFENYIICVGSISTTGRAGINFYYSPNPVSKVLFASSCICELIGDSSSGIALATSFAGIPVSRWLGSLSARGFSCLGKYALHMVNVTSGNITNPTDIAELMS